MTWLAAIGATITLAGSLGNVGVAAVLTRRQANGEHLTYAGSSIVLAASAAVLTALAWAAVTS